MLPPRKIPRRSRLASAAAAVASALDAILPGKKPAAEHEEPSVLRQLEQRPILKLVTPLKACPDCGGPADFEWRDDGQAVRAGCVKCSFSLEAMVAPQSEPVPGCKPPVPLETRQRSAQAEVTEMWNLHADGGFDGRAGQVGHYKTKILPPDLDAINAKPDSEKFENRMRRARIERSRDE